LGISVEPKAIISCTGELVSVVGKWCKSVSEFKQLKLGATWKCKFFHLEKVYISIFKWTWTMLNTFSFFFVSLYWLILCIMIIHLFKRLMAANQTVVQNKCQINKWNNNVVFAAYALSSKYLKKAFFRVRLRRSGFQSLSIQSSSRSSMNLSLLQIFCFPILPLLLSKNLPIKGLRLVV